MNIKPDLLTFQDGSPVAAEAWPRRRQELIDSILQQQFGGMPPAHLGVDVIQRASSR
jgi:hypothetical protein